MAYAQTGLGALDLAQLITQGGPAVRAASKVIEDPALPEVACHILRLNRVSAGQHPGPSCPRKVYTALQKRKGVGLSSITKPLRAAVWARQNPAVSIGIGLGVIGIFVGVGYWIGKGSRKS